MICDTELCVSETFDLKFKNKENEGVQTGGKRKSKQNYDINADQLVKQLLFLNGASDIYVATSTAQEGSKKESEGCS